MIVGLCDDTDEERQHAIDEESNEDVEPDLVEPVHHWTHVPHLGESGEHVIPVDQRVHGLHGGHKSAELVVERSEHCPTGHGEAEVDEETADEKSQHVWHRVTQGQ